MARPVPSLPHTSLPHIATVPSLRETTTWAFRAESEGSRLLATPGTSAATRRAAEARRCTSIEASPSLTSVVRRWTDLLHAPLRDDRLHPRLELRAVLELHAQLLARLRARGELPDPE